MKSPLNRFSSTLALVAPTVALLASNADAAIYIKFDGIDGEVVSSKGHEKWIELQSFSWGVSQSQGVPGGGGTGKVSIQDFTIMHRIDKASPLLFLKCAEGKPVPTVTLSVTRTIEGREVDYYKITLNDVMISSIRCDRPTGAAGDDRPMESVSFKVFPKVEIRYTPIDDATGEKGEDVTSGVIETEPPASL